MTWVCKKITEQLAGCSYNMSIPDLMYETNYEYRAYYVIDGERYYGNILTGRTSYILTKPVVETITRLSLVTSNTASVSGKIIDKGHSCISQYGILYKIGSSENIDFIDDTLTRPKPGVCIEKGLNPANVEINTTLLFNICGLAPETKYYYRFFARNSCGYTNGNILDFTTIGSLIPIPDPDIKFEVLPNTAHFTRIPSLCELNVFIPGGCAWSVSTNNSWVSCINPTSGVGSGSFVFKPSRNTEYENRLGSINVCSQTMGNCRIKFTQDGYGVPEL